MRSLKTGRIVTFRELMGIDLDDAPSLMVRIAESWQPVQDSHISAENIVKNCPAWETSTWEFQYTTDEWVPIFHLVGGDAARDALVDFKIESPNAYNNYDPSDYWVTPKGSPREEYAN